MIGIVSGVIIIIVLDTLERPVGIFMVIFMSSRFVLRNEVPTVVVVAVFFILVVGGVRVSRLKKLSTELLMPH